MDTNPASLVVPLDFLDKLERYADEITRVLGPALNSIELVLLSPNSEVGSRLEIATKMCSRAIAIVRQMQLELGSIREFGEGQPLA